VGSNSLLRIVSLALVATMLSGCTVPAETAPNTEETPIAKDGDSCDVPAARAKGAEGILFCTFNTGVGWSFQPVVGSGVFPGQYELDQLPIEQCKIKDTRPPEVRYFGATGFPAPKARIPNNGEVTVAIVPIDFPDAIGLSDPMSQIGKELNAIDRWTEFFTGGRLKYNWIVPDQWLTMPKDSKYYVWDKSYISDGEFVKMTDKQLQSNQDQATQVFTEAEKVMDLEKVNYAWVFSNPEAKLVDWGPGPTNSATQTVNTETSTYMLDYFPIGTYLFGNVPEYSHQRPLWTSMLHEMGHAHGSPGHAPGNEWTFDVMTAGGTLNAWNGWILGWIPDEDFVCLEGTKSGNHKVRLDSVDLNLGGTIAAVIRLSDHEVIVVESRRKGPFSIDFQRGQSFVMAYYVNSQREANRYDGNSDREMDYYSYFIRLEDPNKPVSEDPYRVDPNVLALLGETLAFEGVKIKFSETGDFDTIEIEVSGK